MPSPIGHALAGVATAWAIDPRADRRLPLLAATLAALPDADLLTPLPHRTLSHSIAAVALVTIVAIVVTGKVTVRRWHTVAICGTAYATHLLLDWLAQDNYVPYGLQALWPFSDRFYLSGLGLFAQTERKRLLDPDVLAQNTTALVQEVAILGTILLVLWLVRVKPAARLAAEVSGGHHPAE